ncbi:hypothetical protein QAD02_015220 [Eretmocerus hayati]|uniref:Uncharacterized protein n=1 Tax=Eretmocerus hayati TaxID=131215 RepID=A0ACC2P7N9_9HYME|nr:hypothetical protein QAD02_015220 [Eretmocerus hayati]
MSDIAAKREARRRRILENSENRLQKITGRSSENSEKEIANKILNPASYSCNLKDDHSSEVQAIPAEDCKTSTRQDNRPDNKYSQPFLYHQQNDQMDAHTAYSRQDKSFSRNGETFISSETSPLKDSGSVATKHHSHALSLYKLLNGPSTSILLAAVVNILLLTNVDLSSSKGILVPWILIAITRWCFIDDIQEAQGRSIFVAALILCNIKPNILHKLETIFLFTNTISKDFALYITSFVLFNWLVSIFWPDLSYIHFPS